MKIITANVLALAMLAATVWFVHTGHIYFAIACLVGVFVFAHTYTKD